MTCDPIRLIEGVPRDHSGPKLGPSFQITDAGEVSFGALHV